MLNLLIEINADQLLVVVRFSWKVFVFVGSGGQGIC